jgi:UDP-N-acetylmuramoyl-tripeptide--D-alanyl-D-alanine ligase
MMSVRAAARILQEDWFGEDAWFSGVTTDSRTVMPGDLFIALVGEKFDGHNFVAEVMGKGAVAAIVHRDWEVRNPQSGIPLIRVENTRLALGRLAAAWRRRFEIPLVAVTGSNGKTTVKEMIASILRHVTSGSGESRQPRQIESSDQVLATEGNLNNDIGVPLMLLRLREQHKYAVIEMGMNHAGEIAYLTSLAKPSVALITNAGVAHVEALGSVEAVARAKGEILEGLDQRGVAVINAEDPYAALWRGLAGNRKVIDFGLQEKAAVTARYQPGPFGSSVALLLPDGVQEVELQVPGEHNVENAAAAAAVAVAMGVGAGAIITGLNAFTGVKGRMQKKQGLHGSTLIDDTYNANPDSVRAALTVLTRAAGRKIFVLGDMGELGAAAKGLHECIGAEARAAGVDTLVAMGELSAYAVAAFGTGGRHFEKIEELIAEVDGLLAPGDTVLIKGSRFMQMERVVKRVALQPVK